MYNIYPPVFEMTLAQFDNKAERFKRLQHPGELANLLKADAKKMAKYATKPYYNVFSIPKKGGEKRVIHNPIHELKQIQQALNLYLQAAYYQIKPPCSYGFIPKPTDEPRPRNIYSNALQHAGSAWVLNLDMQDFFHTVTSRHLKWVFGELFDFPENVVQQLIGLTTYKGMLPMGASTSPVLSNLACIQLDSELTGLAIKYDAIYTRYVDDMTFSLEAEPGFDFVDLVRQKVEKQKFFLNESKIRLTCRADHLEVTGLILKTPKPDVSKRFLKVLKKDIGLYERLTNRDMMERGIFHASVLDKLRKSIKGKVRFLGFIRGKRDRAFRKFLEMGF